MAGSPRVTIIYVLLPASLLLATLAVLAFLWATRRRQFEGLDLAAARPLMEPEPTRSPLPGGPEQRGESDEG